MSMKTRSVSFLLSYFVLTLLVTIEKFMLLLAIGCLPSTATFSQQGCQTNLLCVHCVINSEASSQKKVELAVLLEHVQFFWPRNFNTVQVILSQSWLKGLVHWVGISEYPACQAELLFLSQLSLQMFGNLSLAIMTAVHNREISYAEDICRGAEI